MTMFPTRAEDRPAALPSAASGIEIRQYGDVARFQADAVVMTAAGWQPITQSEASGPFPPSAGFLMAIGVAVALLLSIVLGVIIVVIAALVGMASRKKMLVVTYRYTPPTT